MRFTNSRDGVHRGNLRVEYRLGRDDLINALCADYSSTSDLELLPDHMSRDDIIRSVKVQYYRKGTESVDYWSDDVDEDDEERLREWAAERVDYAFPEARS